MIECGIYSWRKYYESLTFWLSPTDRGEGHSLSQLCDNVTIHDTFVFCPWRFLLCWSSWFNYATLLFVRGHCQYRIKNGIHRYFLSSGEWKSCIFYPPFFPSFFWLVWQHMPVYLMRWFIALSPQSNFMKKDFCVHVYNHCFLRDFLLQGHLGEFTSQQRRRQSWMKQEGTLLNTGKSGVHHYNIHIASLHKIYHNLKRTRRNESEEWVSLCVCG